MMETSQELWAFLDSQRDARVAEIAAESEQRLSRISERVLLWLALVPSWTVTLAEACDFPGAEHGVRELLMRLYKEGFCEYVPAPSLLDEAEDDAVQPLAGSGRDCFNLTDSIRSEVLRRAIRDPQQGKDRLELEMGHIGEAILQARDQDVSVPALIARWATLASSANIVRKFETQVAGLLAEDKLNEVQGWIEAARWLETIVGAELTRVLERTARRLELRHRRSYDEQFLSRFLRRDEQIAAFSELLQDGNNHWALHYVGQGGVGKTMLVRYLTTRYFTEHHLQASICRIDFDYLNPDYPSRAPGLLLDQVSQELRLYGGDRADKEFAHFDDLVKKLHERLGSTNVGNLMPGQVLADSDFDHLIDTFIRALRQLPQPIVLILDTCEELAKIRPDGIIPENVRATFAILERIHRDLPSLRVVFSGRRPLARAGYGWECPTSPHPERSYLRLHEIRGFTLDEARHYLLEQAEVPMELVEPIIQKSLDKGIIDLFRWRRRRDSSAGIARYNPFDLALYASWAREDKALTAEDILAPGVDRYIEGRILGRIRHPHVRALLPSVALLGTFDRETLHAIAHSDERTFNDNFQELTSQEWVQLQQFNFWRVKSGLRERLRAYYRKHYPQALAEARKLLLPYLERITREQPLSSLNVSHFDAALSLLEEDDPRHAAAWWTAIETRFADERNAYDWALTLIEQLQGEDGAIAEVDSTAAAQGRVESTLRPAVLATYASAQLHTRPYAPREATWDEVLNKVERHPLPEGVARLRMRARAGLIAARLSTVQTEAGLKTLLTMLGTLQAADLDEQLAASFVAGLEAAVEYVENAARDLAWAPALRFVALLHQSQMSPELRAFTLTLGGRICILLKQWENARSYFMRALSLLPGISTGQQRWLDWLAPEDLSARVRLEFVRALYPAVLSAQDVLIQIGGELPSEPLTTNDGDRLGSAILLLRGAIGALPSTDQMSFLAFRFAEYSLPGGLPLRNALRTFQPFTMALAETTAALGQLSQALEILEQHSLEAEQSSIDLDTVYASDRAKLRIVRRWRLRDEGYGFSGILAKSSRRADQELLWSLDGLDGPKTPVQYMGVVPRREILAWLHARWRTSYTLRSDKLQAALKAVAPSEPLPLPDARASFLEFSWFFDFVEMKELNNGQVRPFSILTRRDIANVANAALTWAVQHPETPLEAIRLILRANVLAAQNAANLGFSIPTSLLERVGERCAAEMALDEGEMLALRLPERALLLLSQARDWFRKANDIAGEIIAATCEALTLVRLERRAEIIPVLDNILTRYGDLYKLYGPLPQLRDLAERADLDSLPVGQTPWPQQWRPWLVRLVACLIWARDDERRPLRMATLRTWLESHYGAHLITGESALPAEFDGWVVAQEQPARLSTSTQPTFTVEGTPTEMSVADRFVLDIKGRYGQLNAIGAQIDLSHLVQGWEREHYISVPTEFSPLATYTETAVKCIELLPPLREQPIPYDTTIELHTDEFSSAICWEALASLWLEAESEYWDFHRIHCYRTVRRREVRSSVRWDSTSEIIAIAPHFSLQSLQTLIWRAGPYDQWQFTSALSIDIFTSKPGSFTANVVHLVANAREANGSLFLDVSDDLPPTSILQSHRQSRGRLLRSEELSRAFPNLTICLLQCLPAPPTGRSETDRENVSYQRRFAAELHTQGVPVVLAVPPLPEKAISNVLSPFVTALRQKDRLSLALLLAALAEARKATVQDIEDAGGSREDALETALDLCLYIAPQQA